MIEDDYIKREAALEAIDRIRLEVWLIDIPSPTVPEYIEHHEQIQHVLEEIAAVRKEVEQLPGIDEQKTGKWIKDGRQNPHGYLWMHCSACGAQDIDTPTSRTPYCPHCGARMEGEQDG